jgi:hypothetical protein
MWEDEEEQESKGEGASATEQNRIEHISQFN